VSRKTDIEALLKRAETTLKKISSEYDNSLHTKTVSAELRIDIKDYFSNLRSILDYIAHCIVDKYCPEANPRNKLYFPIRADHNGFETEMNKSYPYLISNNKTIYDILESIQPFKKDENIWLTFFNKLNNENKHERLVAQIRIETKTVTVNGPGEGSVSWNSGVTFGSEVSVLGVPIDPITQLPIPNKIVKTEIVTWVDFQFEEINVSVLWLTKESLKQISQIYSDLKNEI
jgi:hypothetical protein